MSWPPRAGPAAEHQDVRCGVRPAAAPAAVSALQFASVLAGIFSGGSHLAWEAGVTLVFVSQRGKSRLREARWLAQGCAAGT